MSIDPASILALVQIARIVNDTVAEAAKGELTRAQLDEAWHAINAEAVSARQAWEASKEASASAARRGGD